MKPKYEGLVIETVMMHKHLFPNLELHEEVTIVNYYLPKKYFKAMLSWILISFIMSGLSFLLPNNIQNIVLTIMIYLIFILVIINILKIYKPKKYLMRKQEEEFKLEQEKYQHHLLLHQNYNRYLLKWNIVYAVIILISFLLSLSVFVGEIIETGNSSLSPISSFFFFMLILYIPTLILNIMMFKRFRIKQKKIEYLINL